MPPLLLFAALSACSPPDAAQAWVMLDAEARLNGVTVLVDGDQEHAPALPLAVDVDSEVIILTDHAEHTFSPQTDEAVWIRGAEAWVDPVWPVARHELRVVGAADAALELADWLGGELIDDLIVGDDVWSAAALEPEAPVGVDAVEPRVAARETAQGPAEATDAPSTTSHGLSLSFPMTVDGDRRAPASAPRLAGLTPELVEGVPSDPRAPLVGLYSSQDGDCLLLDPAGSWSLCREDFEARGAWRRSEGRVELLTADDTRPWTWDGRDLRSPSGSRFTLETK